MNIYPRDNLLNRTKERYERKITKMNREAVIKPLLFYLTTG